MSTGGFDPKAWMFPNFFQPQAANPQAFDPMAGFGRAAKSVEPAMKAAAQAAIEAQGLANRRLQAWLAIPTAAARCRSPLDAMTAQMQFWQTAFQQYTESSRRFAEVWVPVWGAAMPQAGGMYGWLANGATAEPAKPERDLLTFPDAKEAPAVDTGKPGERRAA